MHLLAVPLRDNPKYGVGVLYLEDMRAGAVFELGPRTVTREEIIEFGRAFDPQPFHLTDAPTPFGGLVASGWHTAAVVQRIVVESFVHSLESLGSPGVDELRWLLPVRPGDALKVKLTIVEVTPSRSKPDRGSIKLAYEVTNQRGEVVMTMRGLGMVGRRPA